MIGLLALDIGTTNWKAVVFRHDGTIIDRVSCAASTYSDAYGQYYCAEELWTAVSGLIRRVLANAEVHSVDAVSVASMAETGVPLSKDGRASYKMIPWFDLRSRSHATRLAEALGTERLFEITGLDPNPVFSITKMAWIKDNDRDLFRCFDKWLSVADYVNYRLTGEIATDFSLASRTMALDIRRRDWSPEVLDVFSIPKRLLPSIISAGSRVGSVSQTAAKATSLMQGTPVIVGGHDHHCAFLAAGAFKDDVVLDSSGTVESVMTLLPRGMNPPRTFGGMRIGLFIDPSRYATMGGILASGGSVEWLLNGFWPELAMRDRTEAYERLMRTVQRIQAGSKGLLFLPHLVGAGAPIWDAASRGALIGLRPEHTRQHVSRAVFEGLCFELRVLVNAVRAEFEKKVDALYTVGGGAKNAEWQQLKADITMSNVTIPDVVEATAQGAAMIGATGIGVFPDLLAASEATFAVTDQYRPNLEQQPIYDRLFEIYQEAYASLSTLNARLSEEFA